MIDPTNADYISKTNTATDTGKALRMVKNERMGGFVPLWEDAKSAITLNNSNVNPQAQQINNMSPSTADISTEPQAVSIPQQAAAKPFGLADMLDIINPLQHIPLVNQAYRSITGDQIKPATQIVGGALYGGFFGAGAALVNAVIQKETGKDLTGTAFAMASGDGFPTLNSVKINDPEASLNAAVENAPEIENQKVPPNIQYSEDSAPSSEDLLAFSNVLAGVRKSAENVAAQALYLKATQGQGAVNSAQRFNA